MRIELVEILLLSGCVFFLFLIHFNWIFLSYTHTHTHTWSRTKHSQGTSLLKHFMDWESWGHAVQQQLGWHNTRLCVSLFYPGSKTLQLAMLFFADNNGLSSFAVCLISVLPSSRNLSMHLLLFIIHSAKLLVNYYFFVTRCHAIHRQFIFTLHSCSLWTSPLKSILKASLLNDTSQNLIL